MIPNMGADHIGLRFVMISICRIKGIMARHMMRHKICRLKNIGKELIKNSVLRIGMVCVK
jgi:hypothetical protein